MTTKEACKKLDISWLKVGLMLVFGRRTALYEYLLDKANTAVHILLVEEHGDAMHYVLARLSDVSGLLRDCKECIPADWQPFAEECNNALKAVYDIAVDVSTGKIIELGAVKNAVTAFEMVYAKYKSND